MRETVTHVAGGERDAVIETIAIFSDRLDHRTPLTAIWAQATMLLDGDHGPLSPEQRKALEMVQRNSTRLLQVIEDAEESLAREHQGPAGSG
jgi:signal transduction histidine kinase